MSRIKETSLPGVGVQKEFITEKGRRMGVVHHHSGRLEMFVCSREDPDAATLTVRLDDDDAQALGEALGVPQVFTSEEPPKYEVEGLVFEWIEVEEGSAADGKTIGDLKIRTLTGSSVVAVLRPEESTPSPGPDFGLEVGDTLVVAGTLDGIEAVSSLVRGS